MPRLLAALVVAGAGVAVGLLTLRIVAREPAYSFAGSSAPGRVALLVTGWALIACGLWFWLRRSSSHFGPLLAAAGFAWFLLEWNTPAAGSSLAFTVGLVLFASCPPLAGHAVLTFGDGRLSGMQRAAVGVLYVGGIVVLGLLPALLVDPVRGVCSDCPANLLAVANRPALAADIGRVGLWVSAVAACAVAATVAIALVRASPVARRALWPVLAPGGAYLAFVAAMDVAWVDHGLLSNGLYERRLWFVQAAALIGVVAGVAWNALRVRRRRTAVARLVVRLAQSPPPGGLRSALAEIVGDPRLELAYPLDDSGRLVDADGRTVRLSPELQQTSLIAGRRRLAVLGHRPGQLDDDGLVRAVTDAARLVLENERLQAEAQGPARRASRARGRASWRRVTPSAGGSSAISTTAPSSAWSAGALAPAAALAARSWCRSQAAAELFAAEAERDCERDRRAARARARDLPGRPRRRRARRGDRGSCRGVAGADPDRCDVPTVAFAPGLRGCRLSSSSPRPQARPRARVFVRASHDGDGRSSIDVDARGLQRTARSNELEDRVGALDGTARRSRTAERRRQRSSGVPVRVVIADDEALFRDGLAPPARPMPGFDVLGAVGTAEELIRRVAADPSRRRDRRHPDAADPHRRGVRRGAARSAATTRRSVCSSSRTTSSRTRRCGCSRTTRSGAGYLLKDRVSDVAVLVDALGRIAEGECVVDPTIVARLVERPREAEPPATS